MTFQDDIAAIAEEHGPDVAIEYTAIRCNDLWQDCFKALNNLDNTTGEPHVQ
ncbi:hypothetical protein [Mycobacterium sp. E1747]|uniref:hypothetical protein n=1 Tax=Mycobacterium sp. E1747 TaxID=1834128 RepID=UPI000B2EE189|nr:hypothetical protein [Mycobacterium sp. E1747]